MVVNTRVTQIIGLILLLAFFLIHLGMSNNYMPDATDFNALLIKSMKIQLKLGKLYFGTKHYTKHLQMKSHFSHIFLGLGFFLVLASTNLTALLISSSDMSTTGVGAEILLAVMTFSRLEKPDMTTGRTFSH